ncbi:hypothetical protein V8G57_07545 [Collimonas sp. H4R21]|uniref:Integrase n=1 Tax=Collimonas rhizosphaerae TaxID=3126357 RepID=A0ABU9PTC8_9BURK
MKKIKSSAHKSTEKTLFEFVELARSANPFGVVDFDAVTWTVPQKSRASSARKKAILWFNANFVKKTKFENAVPFPEPFGAFVKATICAAERRSNKGLNQTDHMVTVRAFRYLYAGFGIRSSNPVDLMHADFDVAVDLCKKRGEAEASRYRIGVKLASIAKMIDTHRLAPIRIGWTNTVPKETENDVSIQSRHGDDFEEDRRRKLPSDIILAALAEISNLPLNDNDLLRQRALELLICGGWRMGELLTLPKECWREELQETKDGFPIVNQFGKPVIRYGIRDVPGKKAHVQTRTKWLPTIASDLARRAIDDILRITKPFRQIAEFIASNPAGTLLREPWPAVCDDYLLSMQEVERAVGLASSENGASGRQFVALHDELHVYKKETDSGRWIQAIRKGDLEECLATFTRKTEVFPGGEADYALHEMLFVVGVNFFHSKKPTLNGTALLMTDQQLSDYLAGRGESPSIFERTGYRDEDGKPLRVTARQVRHWLNTLANEGGLPEMELSRWMGRTDARHNEPYNHMTGLALARSIREKLQRGEVQGVIADSAIRINDPVKREEFIATRTMAAHVTDLGVCVHDFSGLPCPLHRDCSSCGEHFLEKGNPIQVTYTTELLEETKFQLDLSKKEKRDGTYGVDNWLDHQKQTVERLETILEIHNDPTIPDGMFIHLGTPQPREKNVARR